MRSEHGYLRRSAQQGRPKAYFGYETESKKGRACSARQEIVETDSIGVLLVYDLLRPGLLYKVRREDRNKKSNHRLENTPQHPRQIQSGTQPLVTAISPKSIPDR